MIRTPQAWCSVVVLASMSLQSCAVHRSLTSAEVMAPPRAARGYARFASAKGQPVAAYVTRDGVRHAFDGRARLEGDTLVFRTEQRPANMERESPLRSERIAVADLQSVECEKIDVIRSTALGLGVLVAALLLVSLTAQHDGVWFY